MYPWILLSFSLISIILGSMGLVLYVKQVENLKKENQRLKRTIFAVEREAKALIDYCDYDFRPVGNACRRLLGIAYIQNSTESFPQSTCPKDWLSAASGNTGTFREHLYWLTKTKPAGGLKKSKTPKLKGV